MPVAIFQREAFELAVKREGPDGAAVIEMLAGEFNFHLASSFH